jgi:tetratricopeptide (TPR) repeat protein
METYAEASEYYKKYGNLDVPMSYKTKGGVILRKWLYNQRANEKLTNERKALLSKIGMNREEKDSWTERYELAKQYYEKFGDLNISPGYKTTDNIWLGKWVYEQRKNKANLSDEQIKMLDSIGMEWLSKKEAAWRRKYSQVEEFFKKQGNIDIPQGYHSSDGSAIGQWMNVQRKYRKAGKLTDEQIELLDRLGMRWDKAQSGDLKYAM